MKKSYWGYQILSTIGFIGLIVLIYVLLKCFSTYEMIDYSEKYSSELLTADGLITTSTFAFLGFVPTNSKSSIIIRKLEWRGLWIKNYFILSILSISLTLISAIAIWWSPIFVPASVVISSIILIFIIFEHWKFNVNPEKKSAKKLIKLIKYINKPDKNNIDDKQKIRNILKKFIEPLKFEDNTELIEAIFTTDTMLDCFLHQYNHNKTTKELKWLVKKTMEEPFEMEKTQLPIFIFNDFCSSIARGKLTPDQKVDIVVSIVFKIKKRNSHELISELSELTEFITSSITYDNKEIKYIKNKAFNMYASKLF